MRASPLILGLVLLSTTCAHSGPGPTAARAPAPSDDPASEETGPPAPAPPGEGSTGDVPVLAEIGFAAVPELPPPEAREVNERALRAHHAGDLEASAQGFAEAVRLAPSYAMARFNWACALARLGRLEEAARELAPLLAADLPTFAPRLRSEPDLEALRVDASIRDLARRYEEAARAGAPLVAYGATPTEAWSQAGVWLHGERRFVPLGPRVSEEGEFAIAATMYSPAEGRVLAVTGIGNDAESPVPIDRLRVRVFRAPLGEPEVDRPVAGDLYGIQVALAPEGALIGAEDMYMHRVSLAISSAGLGPSSADLPTDVLTVGPWLAWSRRTSDPRYANDRGRLVLPGGRQVPLGYPHSALGNGRVHIDFSGSVAFAVSSSSPDCEHPDRYVVDRVDVTTGAADRLLMGEGEVHLYLGPDGALYVQVARNGRTEVRRYADIRGSDAEVLPAGFGITSRPFDYYPYC